MTNRNSLFTGGGTTYCFATNGQVYVGYMSASGTGSLNLSGVSGDFTVRWFDPYNGGGLQTGSVAQVTGGGTRSLGTAPATITKDRVVLVKLIPPADTTPPSVSITAPTNGASLFANLPLTVSATVTDNVAVAFAELWVDGSLQPPVKTSAPFDFTVTNLSVGRAHPRRHRPGYLRQSRDEQRERHAPRPGPAPDDSRLDRRSYPIVLERAGIRFAAGELWCSAHGPIWSHSRPARG